MANFEQNLIIFGFSLFFLGMVFGGWAMYYLLESRLRARQRFIDDDPFQCWKGGKSERTKTNPFGEKRGEIDSDEHEDLFHDLPAWLKRQSE
jgi:hypothetical protein